MHIVFFFMDIVSIYDFSVVLIVVDAKTRHSWTFCTPGKRPPLEILRFFLIQLKTAGRPVQKNLTDLGGILAESSECMQTSLRCFPVSPSNYRWLLFMAERQS